MALPSVVSTMSAAEVILVVFACGAGGLFVGAVGVGGVVVLPALLAAEVEPSKGVVTVFVAFLPVALLKLLLLLRIEGLLPRDASIVLAVGAAAGAAGGGVVVESAPRKVLTMLVGVLALVAALRDANELYHFWRKRGERQKEPQQQQQLQSEGQAEPQEKLAVQRQQEGQSQATGLPVEVSHVELSVEQQETPTARTAVPETPPAPVSLPPPRQPGLRRVLSRMMSSRSVPKEERWQATPRELALLLPLGALVGMASVLTGTGGPLILLPLLIGWKGTTVNRKVLVGCSAALSGSLVVAAVASTLAEGLRPDAGLALLIGGCAFFGAVVGIRVLEVVSREQLQAAMTVLLVAVAVLTITQAATD